MNIVYSSDDNYAQHLCVSIVSLLETHKSTDGINVFVIENGISQEARKNIEMTVGKYRCDLHWIAFAPYEKKLKLDMDWPISISSYARLFLADMLPAWCDRVIYLDCDTIVCRPLSDLYHWDMKSSYVAGVEDLIMDSFKEKVHLKPSQKYINAGILLIDICKWREKNMAEVFLDFIKEHKGKVIHHDQGTINGTLHDSCMVLPPEFNVMTPFYTQRFCRMKKFYELKNYYSKEAIENAKKKPVIIHYTPEYVGRVWETGCRHPKADLYLKYLEMTPWKGNIAKAKKLTYKHRMLHWIDKKMPIWIIRLIRKMH